MLSQLYSEFAIKYHDSITVFTVNYWLLSMLMAFVQQNALFKVDLMQA